MIEPLGNDDLRNMRKAGKIAGNFLKRLNGFIKPGMVTKDIEVFFDQYLQDYQDMEAAFKGYMGYPASLCVSVNEEIIHGIPSDKPIVKGSLVSVDLGIKYKGIFVDTAWTYAVGRISPMAKKLIKVSLTSLYRAIKQIKVNSHIGNLSNTIQCFIEKNGFSVIRKFVGHGIGRELHLPPEVPNFGERGNGWLIQEGYAVAIEPMVSAGDYEVDISADGWTASTKDRSLSAHFEHTVAITHRGPIVMTA